MPFLNLMVDLALGLLFLGTLIYAVHVKKQEKSYTRNSFAFAAAASISSLGVLAIKSVTQKTSVFHSATKIFGPLFGDKATPTPEMPWGELILVGVIFIVACHYITLMYSNCSGVTAHPWEVAGLVSEWRQATKCS